MPDSDLIKDILNRVKLELRAGNKFTVNLSTKIELEVRQDWCGRPYYVNFNKTRIEVRNLQIKRRWAGGFATKDSLSIEYDLTPRQIDRILK